MTRTGGGSAQRRVRETMIAAGGYWRPLAAVARLLEELGELAELLSTEPGSPDPAAVAGELADLWIITAALGDQFLAELPEPGAGAAGPDPSFEALVTAAGPIARVVNHYDGPKVPRAGTAMPSLHGAVEDFQATLGSLAAARDVELGAAVGAKLEHLRERGDIERFGRDGFDPSTAAVLARVERRALPPRLWGAPDPAPGADGESCARTIAGSLTMFAKAARAERLEGFVVEGPDPPGLAGRTAWLRTLVARFDQQGAPRGFELAGEPLTAALAGPTRGPALALISAA
jgi:hypothetical protein